MNSWDDTRMEMCRALARRSTCWKKQTAAIVVIDKRIAGEGYNGTPAGAPHCRDVGPRDRLEHRAWSRRHEIHAEVNAIRHARAARESLRGATLYTVLSPCVDCARAIADAGIVRVVFGELYCEEGLALLAARGVAASQNEAPAGGAAWQRNSYTNESCWCSFHYWKQVFGW